MRTREELAWAAGFFEGEGCIHLTRAHTGVHLQIAQTDPEPLKRFVAATGLGKVYEPRRDPVHPHYKPKWVWEVGSFEVAQAILAMLWPWLSQRRRATARRALSGYLARPGREGLRRYERAHKREVGR